MTNRKPLQPEEVKEEWRECFDFERQEPRKGSLCIWATCPFCTQGRWVRVSHVRGSKRSPYCKAHSPIITGLTKRKFLQPDDVAPQWQEYYDFSRQEVRQGNLRIWTTCPGCNKERWTVVHAIRQREQSPFCQPCWAALEGAASHSWAGGRRKSRGYVQIHWDCLPPDEYRQMAPMVGTLRYVREHRLVMARHLGRPLCPDEIVHHINGIKDDNRLENLRLLKVGNDAHGPGHGNLYYQKWQEALAEIERLKRVIKGLYYPSGIGAPKRTDI